MENKQGTKQVEDAVIARVILDSSLLGKYPITDDLFTCGMFRKALAVVIEMRASGEEIDLVTFGSRFTAKGGKISEIKSLFDAEVKENRAFETYLKILDETRAKRLIRSEADNDDDADQKIQRIKRIDLFKNGQDVFPVSDYYSTWFDEYTKAKKRRLEFGSVGLLTGFDNFDRVASLIPGTTMTLAARPNIGKTSLALCMAYGCASYGQRVLFFSCEMTLPRIMDKIMARITKHYASKFQSGDADMFLSQGAKEIENFGKNLLLVSANGKTSQDIVRITDRENAKQKVDIVFVDYAQIIGDKSERNETNAMRVSKIVQNMNDCAKTTGIVFVILAQINRTGEGTPKMMNIKDSGVFDEVSDVVAILHRESRDSDEAVLMIEKNRNGMAEVDIKLGFTPQHSYFYEK